MVTISADTVNHALQIQDATGILVGDLEVPAVLAVELVKQDAELLQEDGGVALMEVVVDGAEAGPPPSPDAVLLIAFQAAKVHLCSMNFVRRRTASEAGKAVSDLSPRTNRKSAS
jgi:hypothetical protein